MNNSQILKDFLNELPDLDSGTKSRYLEALDALEEGNPTEKSEDLIELNEFIEEQFFAAEEEALAQEDTEALKLLVKLRDERNKIFEDMFKNPNQNQS